MTQIHYPSSYYGPDVCLICPECREEYLNKSTCPDCQVDLVSEIEDAEDENITELKSLKDWRSMLL